MGFSIWTVGLLNKAFLHSKVRESGFGRESCSSQASEEGALTAYIRCLGDRLEPVSGPVFDRFLRVLSGAVKRELHRRGLWDSPPRFVGIEAAEIWCDEAVQELVSECYIFIMQRLRTLHQHLKLKPNIDGLVLLNVKHFLYERQKRCDPLGFRVFDIARSAVRQAALDGTLRVVAGDRRIENSTVLQPLGRSIAADGSAAETVPAAKVSGKREGSETGSETVGHLQEACRSWVDALMPELLLAHGRQREAVGKRLAQSLGTLNPRYLETVTFKALVDGLKAAARVRWKAVWVHEQGGAEGFEKGETRGGFRGRSASPSSGVVFQQLAYEDEQSFQVLVRKVSKAVESAPATVQHRRYLPQLWKFLCTSSADPGTVAVPSRRRVAELLGIPRYLLPDLYRQLGKIIDRCREQEPAPAQCRQGGRGL